MIYAIGDIHGMVHKLQALIEELPLTPDDHLVFIGDYVDRGSNPAATVGYLLELEKQYSCTFLMGNHESMFLSFLGWEAPQYFGGEAFLQNGGETTLTSYGYFEADGKFSMPDDHVEFYKNLKLWYLHGEYLFVHAGLSRDVMAFSDVKYALEQESPREILWQRATIDLPHSLGVTIVYGHTPQPDMQVRWNLPYSIGIDTGCVYGGLLTALRLPDETVFQV